MIDEKTLAKIHKDMMNASLGYNLEHTSVYARHINLLMEDRKRLLEFVAAHGELLGQTADELRADRSNADREALNDERKATLALVEKLRDACVAAVTVPKEEPKK